MEWVAEEKLYVLVAWGLLTILRSPGNLMRRFAMNLMSSMRQWVGATRHSRLKRLVKEATMYSGRCLRGEEGAQIHYFIIILPPGLWGKRWRREAIVINGFTVFCTLVCVWKWEVGKTSNIDCSPTVSSPQSSTVLTMMQGNGPAAWKIWRGTEHGRWLVPALHIPWWRSQGSLWNRWEDI